MSIARCRTVVGSLYGLMRNALGLNVATSLEAQELSCTVAPDRRLVVLGHEPIAGFARDHGTVANEAAMLALHTLDSATLLVDPRFVAPGDSCTRADDPGWRWHCISGHGQSLSDWERRPLAEALAGKADVDHAHAISDVSGLAEALAGKQSTLANAAALARITAVAGGPPKWDGGDWPGSGGTGGDLVVADWLRRVALAGGSVGSDSPARAKLLVAALRESGLLRTLVRVDAWLGSNSYTAATVPLIDRVGVGGRAVGVVDAAWSETTGLAFSGSSYVDTLIRPAQLGANLCGGYGWWEAVSEASDNVEPMGAYSSDDSQRYVLDLRSSFRAFRWGSPLTMASSSTARVAGHYYGQRSSATSRTLYVAGSSLANNTTSDTASGASDRTIWIGGSNSSDAALWTGRCLIAYLTDGTLTAEQIATLHSVLSDWLTDIGRS